MTGRTRLLRRGAVAVLILAAAACTDSPDPTVTPSTPTATASAPTPTTTPSVGARPGGTVRLALGADPVGIDPISVADDAGLLVVDALFDSLVELRPDGRVGPAVAQRWEHGPLDDAGVPRPDASAEERASRLTLWLDPDERWHDGTPVVAEDVARAWNTMVSTGAPNAFLLEPVAGFDASRDAGVSLAGVSVLDQHVLQVDLQRPLAEFIEVLSHPALAPLPPVALDPDASDAPRIDDAYAARPVGNGPFAMADDRVAGEFIRLRRADTHRRGPGPGGTAWLDEVIFRIYLNDPANEAQYADFGQGRVDVAAVPPGRLDEAAERFGRSTAGYEGPGVLEGGTAVIYYLGVNTDHPEYDDPRVRAALSQLVDRDAITADLLLGTRRPLRAIVPPGVAGAREGACGVACTFAPSAAAAVFAPGDGTASSETSSGEDDPSVPDDGDGPPMLPETIALGYNDSRTHAAVAGRIESDIEAALGVEVDRRAQDLSDYLVTVRDDPEVEVFRLGWPADVPTMGAFLRPLFSSEQVGANNLSRYRSETVDSLLAAAAVELDASRRIAIYQEVEDAVLADMPVIPVFAYQLNRVVAERVLGLRHDATGRPDLARAWVLDADQ